MSKLAMAAVVVVLGGSGGGVAEAGPTGRVGLTGAIGDEGAPGKYEIGPMIAVGMRGGPFVGELEWSYLSFFDPDTSPDGVQRIGVSLRADLLRSYATRCMFRYACTRASSVWGEIGAGERFGQWVLDSSHVAPASSHQPEAHVAIGIELDNQIAPMRNGWQVGVRFAVAPRGYDQPIACRGASCEMPAATATTGNHGGYDGSVLVEWMFLFGE
jgi:hypothetical protein